MLAKLLIVVGLAVSAAGYVVSQPAEVPVAARQAEAPPVAAKETPVSPPPGYPASFTVQYVSPAASFTAVAYFTGVPVGTFTTWKVMPTGPGLWAFAVDTKTNYAGEILSWVSDPVNGARAVVTFNTSTKLWATEVGSVTTGFRTSAYSSSVIDFSGTPGSITTSP